MSDRDVHSPRFLWREHVANSVDWSHIAGMKEPADGDFLGICLDLYVGGTVQHIPTREGFLCADCPIAQGDPRRPLCEIHLGIVEAFAEGLSGRSAAARREVVQGRCTIHVSEES